MGYQYQDHALFVGFAPFEKPEIAVAVVVEHGGGGGAVAAPIANRILRQYFDLKKPASPRSRADEGKMMMKMKMKMKISEAGKMLLLPPLCRVRSDQKKSSLPGRFRSDRPASGDQL